MAKFIATGTKVTLNGNDLSSSCARAELVILAATLEKQSHGLINRKTLFPESYKLIFQFGLLVISQTSFYHHFFLMLHMGLHPNFSKPFHIENHNPLKYNYVVYKVNYHLCQKVMFGYLRQQGLSEHKMDLAECKCYRDQLG